MKIQISQQNNARNEKQFKSHQKNSLDDSNRQGSARKRFILPTTPPNQPSCCVFLCVLYGRKFLAIYFLFLAAKPGF
jgi:hypothetical protein